MANFTYNGVTIPYLLTRKCDSEVRYSDDRADYLSTRHRLFVEGLVYAEGGTPAAEAYNTIRHALEQPRKALTYQVNGEPIIESSGLLDVSNGPHPEVISIDRVLGSEALKVSFAVTTDLYGCPEKGNPLWLSNRWEEYVTIGPDLLSRLVRTGKVVLTTNLFGSAAYIADRDSLRGLITPPIHRFCNRISSEYKLQSDGLAMTYTFVDQEVDVNPPEPAVKIDDCTYTETSPDGAKRYGEVRIVLTGYPRPEARQKRALLAAAITIGVRRLQEAGALTGRGDTPVIMSLSEQLHRNKVAVSLRCLIPASLAATSAVRDTRAAFTWGGAVAGAGLGAGVGSTIPGVGTVIGGVIGGTIGAFTGSALGPSASVPSPRLPIDLVGWGKTPAGSDSAGIPDVGLRARAGVVLLAEALNDPCLAKTVGVAPQVGPGGTVSASAPRIDALTSSTSALAANTVQLPDAVFQIVDLLQDESALIERSLAPIGVYTHCTITSHWDRDEHTAHLAACDTQGESAFVPYASPTMQLVIDYEAEKVGGAPGLPPNYLGTNYVLLSHTKGIPQADLGTDFRTTTFKISGQMVFGVKNPELVVTGAAIPPWVIDQLDAMKAREQGQIAATIEQFLASASIAASGYDEPRVFPWSGYDGETPGFDGQVGNGQG
jgi:hypothetical protein